jgi:hypothetical protein
MALILVLARKSIGKPWAATTVAGAYLAYRLLVWPALLGMGFPVPTVPFYLLFVGLAVDLAFRTGRHQLALTAGVGALLVTAFGYGTLWIQAQLRPWILGDAQTESAPPVAYWTMPIALAVLLAVVYIALLYISRFRDRVARA